MKNILIAVMLVIVGAAGAWVYLNLKPSDKPAGTDHQALFCDKHQIAEKDCPWCDSSLVEKQGMCVAHGVPAALCSRCNPVLTPGFKAEKDWCAGHNLPESQCAICRGSEPAVITAPSLGKDFCGKHQIAEKDCPWCDSTLIEKLGMCVAHGVPEALCSRCNPALIPGFKAEKDWCAGHNLPESQCRICRGEATKPGEAS